VILCNAQHHPCLLMFINGYLPTSLSSGTRLGSFVPDTAASHLGCSTLKIPLLSRSVGGLDVISGPDFFFPPEFRSIPLSSTGTSFRPDFFRFFLRL
jgi:hypothetical protein